MDEEITTGRFQGPSGNRTYGNLWVHPPQAGHRFFCSGMWRPVYREALLLGSVREPQGSGLEERPGEGLDASALT